jgi:uncharacterized HhH-GPD family protein
LLNVIPRESDIRGPHSGRSITASTLRSRPLWRIGSCPVTPEAFVAQLHLAQEARADALLSRDPFALLVGMLLDQQIPMERAFAGPRVLAERLGSPDRLEPKAVATLDADELAAAMSVTPAVHRFPGSMAGRVHALARAIVDSYGGDTDSLWNTASDGTELLHRLEELPGFGRQKAQIFVALLGKQLGVRPDGWREAAGPYGEEGSHRSVADVRDAASLARVRTYKQEQKKAGRSATGGSGRR